MRCPILESRFVFPSSANRRARINQIQLNNCAIIICVVRSPQALNRKKAIMMMMLQSFDYLVSGIKIELIDELQWILLRIEVIFIHRVCACKTQAKVHASSIAHHDSADGLESQQKTFLQRIC